MQTIYDLKTRRTVQLLSEQTVWGMTSYTVYDPFEGKVYSLQADEVSFDIPGAGNALMAEAGIRYRMLLPWLQNELRGGAVSVPPESVIPLPHQRYVLERVLRSENIRFILADEVGLGKTIEAGLVIRELKKRGLIKRILIVCPTGLVTQWHMEMQEKFGEQYHVILPEEFDTIRRITRQQDIYGQFDQVISPMDAIKPLDHRAGWSDEKVADYNRERSEAIVNSGWDLIVIDEAHRTAGSGADVARHRLGRMLSEASPYLLLLTATPHSGKTEPFLRLVRMIDADAFPNERAVVKEQVAPYLIRSEKREALDNEGNKLFKNRTTRVLELHWEAQHSLQRELYEAVTKYVSKAYRQEMQSAKRNMMQVLLLIMFQRLVSSSTRAVRVSLEKRVGLLQESTAGQLRLRPITIENEDEETLESVITAVSSNQQNETKELQNLIALAKQAEYQYPDVKLDKLREVLEDLFAEDPQRKVIIFTEFTATQDYLREALQAQGFKTSQLNGSLNMEERNEVLAEFRDSTDILISTDAGGEGLNLQFADCVINYDLPWNPMKIEQRIGRVDRIGQTRDVQVFNFVLADTVENRVREVLEDKLSVILKEIGVDKYADVLDSESAEWDYTGAYMDALAHPKNVEKCLETLEEDIREQAENRMKILDMLRDEKDLDQWTGADRQKDIEPMLGRLFLWKNRSEGKYGTSGLFASLSDERVQNLLSNRLLQLPEEPIQNVVLDGIPHEAGWFMLWQVSAGPAERDRLTVPIFINKSFVLRPLAGKKLWEAMLRDDTKLTIIPAKELSSETWQELYQKAEYFAENIFLQLKQEKEQRAADKHKRKMLALSIREGAAERIGIANIRNARLNAIAEERKAVEAEYRQDKQIHPEFRLELILDIVE